MKLKRHSLYFQHERFTRSANGQVQQIFVNGTQMLTNIQYHATGTVKSWTWANGQTYDRFTDSDARTVRYTVGDKLQNLVYDNTGRIQQSYRSLPATANTA